MTVSQFLLSALPTRHYSPTRRSSDLHTVGRRDDDVGTAHRNLVTPRYRRHAAGKDRESTRLNSSPRTITDVVYRLTIRGHCGNDRQPILDLGRADAEVLFRQTGQCVF